MPEPPPPRRPGIAAQTGLAADTVDQTRLVSECPSAVGPLNRTSTLIELWMALGFVRGAPAESP